jgi:hypothetical protein
VQPVQPGIPDAGAKFLLPSEFAAAMASFASRPENIVILPGTIAVEAGRLILWGLHVSHSVQTSGAIAGSASA